MILLVFAGSVKVWPLAWTVSVRRRGRTARWTRRSRAACELSPPTSTPPIRTPGAIRSVRAWSYAYAAAAAIAGQDDEESEHDEGRAAAGATALRGAPARGRRPSWTVAFTRTGCHTKRPVGGQRASRRGPFAQASGGKRTIMTTKTDQVPRVPLRGETEIPQLGFGVFQVPPEDTAEAVDARARRPATATSTPPPRTATRRRSARRSAPRASPARTSSSRRSCFNSDHGYDAGAARVQAEPRAGSASTTSTST